MQNGSQFPRGRDLPSQSPLFWVQQKDRYLRQLLIGDIQDMTKRRLVVYYANQYLNGSEINHGDISYLNEVISDVNGEPVDLFLNTGGGQTDATESIVSLLQSSAPGFRIFVPQTAKSNGTMICLASSEILMGPTSELGPIDPSLGGTPTSILSEEIVRQQNFPLHMAALYAIAQTKSLATRLLTEGMMKGLDPTKIAETVQFLASKDKYFSHGSAIDHREATSLGLKVNFMNSEDPLWKRVWLLHCMYAHDTERGSIVKVFEGRNRSISVSAPASP